ncbi:Alpha-tectorin [Mytilus coruscus]|uniref:Alpha-tectorin n=1 Tax=Mytilus coruscus TaxID=42192 RepID=A0A6J8BFV5_MYTCO|nr:Alpha-tectorin [Mytilus coruscus]
MILALVIDIPLNSSYQETTPVNKDGTLSFLSPLKWYIPSSFPYKQHARIVATYWADINTETMGDIWYRETYSSMLLGQASSEIRSHFPQQSQFVASWIFISTWENVSFHGADAAGQTQICTFQCILVTDGKYSFAIFNYNRIQLTSGTARVGIRLMVEEVGFDAGDGIHFYSFPGSQTPGIINITKMSNVGIPGKFIFRVDLATIVTSLVKGKTNKPFPLGLGPTLSPYPNQGPIYTYPPDRHTYLDCPFICPSLGLGPTLSPYLNPGPIYTYPPDRYTYLLPISLHGPSKVPPTRFPGEIPTLEPYKPFSPGLGPTISTSPGPDYTYPPLARIVPPTRKVPTQYPGQTFRPGKEPTLSQYKPFTSDLLPTMGPYFTTGPGYTYPPGKVPQTNYLGEIPTLSPNTPFPPVITPKQSPFITPGSGYTYPPGKVQTLNPGKTNKPGIETTLAPQLTFPTRFFANTCTIFDTWLRLQISPRFQLFLLV